MSLTSYLRRYLVVSLSISVTCEVRKYLEVASRDGPGSNFDLACIANPHHQIIFGNALVDRNISTVR